MQRRTTLFLTFILSGVLLASCRDSGGSTTNASLSPTATSELTVGDALVGDQQLPGCTMTGEGSLFEGTVTRSYDCADNGRLTTAVIFHKTEEEARKLQDNAWGTRDGATDQIRRTLVARPVNLASLRVTDVTDSFGKFGADQENVWCATFTDQGGTTTVTEFHGAFRYEQVVVSYTSVATDGAPCDGQSQARQSAQTFAREQLQKLKSTLP